MGPESVYIVKRLAQAAEILIRKTDNQIQMQVDVSACQEPFHNMLDARPVVVPPNSLQRRLVGRLNAHLQLDAPFRSRCQQLQVFVHEQARLDFQMEVDIFDHANHIAQQRPVVGRIAVEGPVDEFDLMHAGCDELFQLLQHEGHGAEADGVVHARQAVLAVKRAAAGAFVIHDLMVEQGKILPLIGKGQTVQLGHFLIGITALNLASDSSHDARYSRPVFASR